MAYSLMLSMHVVVCLLLILAVELQSGKGGGFAGIFGGSSSDAIFSAPSGSNFIRKLTTGLAVTFFTTSLFLTYLGARRGIQSVVRQPLPMGAPAAAPAAAANPGAAAPSDKAPAAPGKTPVPALPAAAPSKPTQKK